MLQTADTADDAEKAGYVGDAHDATGRPTGKPRTVSVPSGRGFARAGAADAAGSFITPAPFEVDPSRSDVVALADEPPRIDISDFRQIVMNCVASGASDLTIQTDRQPRASIHGRHYRLTRRPWTQSEVDQILREIYGADNAPAEIKGRNILDFAWEIRIDRFMRQRFRVNATGIHSASGDGVEITLRALPSSTPTLDGVSLDRGLLPWMTPRNGIIVIAGATGQGKSTTMAAVTRHHLEDVGEPRKIVDIQKPIEYTFYDVTRSLEGSASTIAQSEVGRHIHSFSDGVWSALRRAPDIINVGEARDQETILASIEASLTGHLVYTTTHAGTVEETLRRMVTAFGPAERESRAFDLITSLKFVMTQYLLPSREGTGRVPVREFLAIDARVRDLLVRSPSDEWSGIVADIMSGRRDIPVPRLRLGDAVRDLLDNKKISETVARPYLMMSRSRGDDEEEKAGQPPRSRDEEDC